MKAWIIPACSRIWMRCGRKRAIAAGVTDQGILVNRIRTFKMTNTLHNTLFVASGGEDGNTLQLAEALAFGRQCIGDVGGVLAGYDLPQDQRRYLKFFHRNFDYYRDIDNVADVAVLHSYATMGFNNDRPAVSTMLFEQALIQGKVPFDIIFDDNLKDLSKYRVLALPDQECLTDEQMDLIRQFVHGGGGLVATEGTSLYTAWRQRRREFGLKDLLKVEAPPWRGALEPDPILKIATVHNQIRKRARGVHSGSEGHHPQATRRAHDQRILEASRQLEGIERVGKMGGRRPTLSGSHRPGDRGGGNRRAEAEQDADGAPGELQCRQGPIRSRN